MYVAKTKALISFAIYHEADLFIFFRIYKMTQLKLSCSLTNPTIWAVCPSDQPGHSAGLLRVLAVYLLGN